MNPRKPIDDATMRVRRVPRNNYRVGQRPRTVSVHDPGTMDEPHVEQLEKLASG